MFCCTLLYAPLVLQSSWWRRELVALLSLSFWCLVIVMWLFLAMTWVCLKFVNAVFPGHNYLLFKTHWVLDPDKDLMVHAAYVHLEGRTTGW